MAVTVSNAGGTPCTGVQIDTMLGFVAERDSDVTLQPGGAGVPVDARSTMNKLHWVKVIPIPKDTPVGSTLIVTVRAAGIPNVRSETVVR